MPTPDPAVRAPSRLILGCMGLGGSWSRTAPDDAVRVRARAAVAAALDLGITMFDHADIYCHGWSESVFGQAIRDLGVDRGTITIQGKCGIRMAGDPEGTVGLVDPSHGAPRQRGFGTPFRQCRWGAAG